MSQWRRPARLLASVCPARLRPWNRDDRAIDWKESSWGVCCRGTTGDDPDFARAVKEWTTRPEFSSPLVDHLPKVRRRPLA